MGRHGRSKWFAARAAQPGAETTTEPPVGQRPLDRGAFEWDSLGPFNIGGRSTSLAVDPRNSKRVILGTAGGGVWETRDSGKHWTYIWDDQTETLNIGSVAFDPRNSDILYAGTGEANLSGDSYPGTGLYRREGQGAWKKIGQAGGATPEVPKRIGAIAADPFSTRGHIFVGSATTMDGELSGLYEGREDESGGWTWTFVTGFAFGDALPPPGQPPLPISPPYQCHSVLFHPKKKGTLFVTVNLRGWRSGIWRRKASGEWEHLTRGLPPPDSFGRTSLAISAAQPELMWAYAAHRRGSFLGVFISVDSGGNWCSMGGDHFRDERQFEYTNCIAVHPDNADFAICGSVDLHRTQDGGLNWELVTEWNLPEEDPHYTHADHHALAVTQEGWVYDANDGGMAFSRNFGFTWEPRQTGLVTTMFYDVDVSPANADGIAGGAQDNGTLIHDAGEPKGQFLAVRGGDGGWTVYNPDDEKGNRIWGSSQNVDIGVADADADWSDATPDGLTSEEQDATWLSFIAMDTSEGRLDPRPVFLGTTRIWRTRNDGGHWDPVSHHLDGSPVTAIEIADMNPRYIFAGTQDGGVFRSMDGGNSWSEDVAGIELPRGLITRIESHPDNHNHLLLTMGSTKRLGEAEAMRLRELKEFQSHVYLSTDAGRSWRNADPQRLLPDVPHGCVTFETVEPYRAFVATDMGVFRGIWSAENQGYSWAPVIGNLPNSMVTDIVYHAKSHTLTAATYGRGIWRLALEPPARRKAKKKVARK